MPDHSCIKQRKPVISDQRHWKTVEILPQAARPFPVKRIFCNCLFLADNQHSYILGFIKKAVQNSELQVEKVFLLIILIYSSSPHPSLLHHTWNTDENENSKAWNKMNVQEQDATRHWGTISGFWILHIIDFWLAYVSWYENNLVTITSILILQAKQYSTYVYFSQ